LKSLAGYTNRVHELLSCLQQIKEPPNKNASGSAGLYLFGDHIKFDKVNVISPLDGRILISNFNLEIFPGTKYLITGPKGSGKTSLFRLLCEIWPLNSGTIIKPKLKDILYIAPKAYLPTGTLRDQLIYPDTRKEMEEKGFSDVQLEALLRTLDLSYLLYRPQRWNAITDWSSALSTGEKQRLALVRLFYHKPKFVILDECTGSLSTDLETTVYNKCTEYNITPITISNRREAQEYHDYLIELDGDGGWVRKDLYDYNEDQDK